MRILLTTTSFQDTPGAHHDVLNNAGFEIVRQRGPLTEAQMLDLVKSGGGFDAFLNGDDQITAKVIDASLPRLKVIAKYGIGLDSIDVKYATSKKLPVLNTPNPGINDSTVAEHAYGLMVSLAKGFWFHLRAVKQGQWKRQTGVELLGKTVGIVGMGQIGKEMIKRAGVFKMNCVAFDAYFDEAFAKQYNVRRLPTALDVLKEADIISLHCPLTPETKGLINKTSLSQMKDGAMIINTARGGLVIEEDVAEACKSGKLRGYAADVLDIEPMKTPHPFQEIDNILITPHIGSRTLESVQRQGLRAANNLVNYLKGNPDYIQANKF